MCVCVCVCVCVCDLSSLESLIPISSDDLYVSLKIGEIWIR